MRILRVVSVLLLGGALLICLVGTGVAAYTAPSASPQRISGIAVGHTGDYARIPRRSLDCTRQTPSALSESCAVTIDGKALRVDVAYQDPPGFDFRECRVSYEARAVPCRAANFTLGGGIPVYAVVPDTELGVPDSALQAIRREHRLENLYEADWLALAKKMAVGLALSAGLAIFLLPWGRVPIRAVAAAAGGAAMFLLSSGALMVFLFAMGFVD